MGAWMVCCVKSYNLGRDGLNVAVWPFHTHTGRRTPLLTRARPPRGMPAGSFPATAAETRWSSCGNRSDLKSFLWTSGLKYVDTSITPLPGKNGEGIVIRGSHGRRCMRQRNPLPRAASISCHVTLSLW